MKSLLEVLKRERDLKYSGGIYHFSQIEMSFNSNRIEGSRLNRDQTRHIFETKSFFQEEEIVRLDDVLTTANHFRAFDYILDHAKDPLTEDLIKKIHKILMAGTDWTGEFKIGDYKTMPNIRGSLTETTPPGDVGLEMGRLISSYRQAEASLEEIIDFHYRFEKIHPFQDGNGRVGRLIMFKECLRNDIVPFIIGEDHKLFYYRGLEKYEEEKGYLADTILSSQDSYKLVFEKLGIDL